MLLRAHTCAAIAFVALLGCSGSGRGELSRAATVNVEVTYVHGGTGPGAVLFTDGDGNVVEERRTEPFGFEVEDANYRALDLGPLGQPVDSDTAWSFHGARWFQPESARWLSIDPPTQTPDATKYMAASWSLHPYQYVDQNPILYWDPDGRDKRTQDDSTVARVADAVRTAVKQVRAAQKVVTLLQHTLGIEPTEMNGVDVKVVKLTNEAAHKAVVKIEQFITTLLTGRGKESAEPK